MESQLKDSRLERLERLEHDLAAEKKKREDEEAVSRWLRKQLEEQRKRGDEKEKEFKRTLAAERVRTGTPCAR